MTLDADLCACEYVLIRVAPDPIRNEYVNVGVALYHPIAGGFVGVRVNPDLRRARQLSSSFEEDDLVGLGEDLLAKLSAHTPTWSSREYFLQLSQESFSHSLQLTAPTLVLTHDPAHELERLYLQFAAPAEPERTVMAGARHRMLRYLRHVFEEERVLRLLTPHASASKLFGGRDAFRFDFHFQPRPADHHVIQAVQLGGDEGLVKELCFTVADHRARLGALDAVGFVESKPMAEESAAYHRGLLAVAGIRVLELDQAREEAARIRGLFGTG